MDASRIELHTTAVASARRGHVRGEAIAGEAMCAARRTRRGEADGGGGRGRRSRVGH